MFAWQATVQDEAGNAVPFPVITVYESDGETLANIFDEAGAPIANPMTGTAEGFVQFWASEGTYNIAGASGIAVTEVWEVSLGRPENVSTFFDTVSDMKGDSDLKVGDVVETLGYLGSGDGGGGKYVIVQAGTGVDDGGSFIDLPASGVQAQGLFDGRVIAAEQFGCVDDVECSVQLQRANNYAMSLAGTMTDSRSSRKMVKLTLSSNIKIANKVVLGQVSRSLDIDMTGGKIVCEGGGDLTALDPAVTVWGDNSTRFLAMISANKLSSGYLIKGRNSHTWGAVCIRFASGGFGVKINDYRGSTIYNPWAWEYAGGDSGSGVASNYTGTGVVLDGWDFTVIGTHVGWCGTAIHFTENSGLIVVINPHPYCNKASNAETDPRINPIAILNDSPNRHFISDPYVDGGYIVDNTATLQVNGGFHFVSATAAPGLSTPYTRIKNVIGANDKITNYRGFQSSFGVFDTDYTGPDLAIWNGISGLVDRASPDVYRQHQKFFTGNLGASPHEVEALITGGNLRKRQVFSGGDYVEEETGKFSGRVGRILKAFNFRLNSETIGGTDSTMLIGPNTTGLRNNHSNGRLEVLVSSASSIWHWATTGAFRPSTDVTADIGSTEFRVANAYVNTLRPGSGTTSWSSGVGSPEGVVTAFKGSIWAQTDAGNGTSGLWFKATGSGNTGWILMASA